MLWDTGGEQLTQTCGLGKDPEKMLSKLCKSKSQDTKCLAKICHNLHASPAGRLRSRPTRELTVVNSAPTSSSKAQPP